MPSVGIRRDGEQLEAGFLLEDAEAAWLNPGATTASYEFARSPAPSRRRALG
jgi:hypothetical protein